VRSWKDFFPSVYAFIYAFFFFYDGACAVVFMMMDRYGIHVFPKNHGAFLHCFVRKKEVKRQLKGVRLCEEIHRDIS